MLHEVLLFTLLLCPMVVPKRRHKDEMELSYGLEGDLISSLRNDVNLDLSMDEEYEDLRAELLAYHTALASLTGPEALDQIDAATPEPHARRSMKTTPCWQLGGICVNHNLCKNHQFLTEVPGCKDNLEVCCFTWNDFQTRDLRDKGISNSAFPWSHVEEIGGKGLIGAKDQDSSDIGLEHLGNVHIPYIPVSMQVQASSKYKANKKKNKKVKKNNRNIKRNAPILVIVKPNK